MRKGTHSCVECRNRKIRCIFSSSQERCNECIHRGKQCLSQERTESELPTAGEKKSVREWLGQIDGTTKKILQRLDALGKGSSSNLPESNIQNDLDRLRFDLLSSRVPISHSVSILDSTTPSSSADPLLPSQNPVDFLEQQINPPVLSLFDNTVLRRGQDRLVDVDLLVDESISLNRSADAKSRILGSLKALAPDDDLLRRIVQASSHIQGLWEGLFPSTEFEAGPGQLEPFMAHLLERLHSDNVATIVKILLCLAMAIQQIPFNSNLDQTGLETLQTQYIAAADAVLSIDEKYSRTLDGLECMMIQAHWYVNLGKPHKAWLIFRRAINTCHLLGINRQTAEAANALPGRWKGVWSQLWQGDRQSSMLLGLPHAGSSIWSDTVDVHDDTVKKDTREGFWIMLGIIAGHVIERNQNPKKMTLVAALEIDQELDILRSSSPSDWWRPLPDPGMCSSEVEEIFLGQLLYHNTRKLVHLPLMLRAMTDPRYDFSRVATLESSREMVRIYQILRDPEISAISVCNTVDFQVFTAAMVWVVHLLSDTNRAGQKIDGDWEIVQDATHIFKRAAEDGRCNVAAQAATLLQAFSEARWGGNSFQAVVPYFGKIRITPGEAFSARIGEVSSSSEHPASMQVQESETGNSSAGRTFEFNADPMMWYESQNPSVDLSFSQGAWDENGMWEAFRSELVEDWTSLGDVTGFISHVPS
jgi:hypothetical protein